MGMRIYIKNGAFFVYYLKFTMDDTEIRQIFTAFRKREYQ
jgi:hypothetical protein